MAQVQFADIDFGYASAERERAEAPALLIEGFFDLDGVRDKIRNGGDFLCLGYKGSGKSAIAEHLQLIADKDPNFFVRRLYLSDFPFTDFGQVLRGSQDAKARYPATWAWLLLIQILDSLAGDAGAKNNDPKAFTDTVDLLRRFGFLPTPGLHEIVLKSKERSFRTSLGKTIEGGVKGTLAATGDVNFLTLVQILRTLIEGTRSESRHLVIIDGLDDILLREPVQFDTLAALVVEAGRLNAALRDAGAPAKVVLLCRTDIYDRLPGPNLNKIRLDSTVELDWFSDPSRPERSNLVALAIAKGRVSDPQLMDFFAAFLPMTMRQSGGQISTQRFLLERTRHVPRDFLQLLKCIQAVAGRRKGRITEDVILAGIRQYARSYFISEIRDEIAGHLTQAERDAAFDTLGRLPAARFTLDEFTELSQSASVEFNPNRFLDALYDCGAVGTSEGAYVTFRYRNPHVPFNPREKILLHKALIPALNVPGMHARS